MMIALAPLFLWASVPNSQAPASAETVHIAVPLVPEITSAEIEAHVRFLASDELKGRVTGTPEAERAARYLALVLAQEKVEPAGDDGTFFQKVPIVWSHSTGTPELALTDNAGTKTALALGVDFEVTAQPCDAQDLRVVRVNEAANIPHEADPKIALFVDASSSDRKNWLEAAGFPAGRGFGCLVAPGRSESGTPRSSGRSRPSLSRAKDAAPAGVPVVKLNGSALTRARAGEIHSISLATHAAREELPGMNVVGRIRGHGTPAHPELKDEVIVVSAHYDHLDHDHEGAFSEGPDQVWNGADDDASGTSAVLEIAGALAAGKPPARTIVFLLATGEEEGLLGTNEYLERPVAPLDHTIANLNFEMIGRPDPKVGGAGNLWLTGYEATNERTNLGPAFEAAGLAIKHDPYPEQHYYERSDNIAFVRKGIVGQTLSSFNGHGDYHQPTDEADKCDFKHMEACTRAGFAALRLISDGTLTPTWAKGKTPGKSH